MPLKEKIQLSHDTYLYRFALPQENSVLGLPVGKHFKIFSPNKVGSTPGQWNGLKVCDLICNFFPVQCPKTPEHSCPQDQEEGKDEIERKYTPTSSDDDLGLRPLCRPTSYMYTFDMHTYIHT